MSFNLDKTYENVACKDITNATEIVKAIRKVEDKYQWDMDDMYANIQENMLKRIRRGTLVTGQKFDWDKPLGLIR